MLTPREIAQKCQLNYRTVLRAIEAGELPASRLRGRLRVDEDDFAAWVDKNKVLPDEFSGYEQVFTKENLDKLVPAGTHEPRGRIRL